MFIIVQITYETIGVVQMAFLRLLSQEGYQNFTYTCVNSAAWSSSPNDNNNLSIKLLGDDNEEFSYNRTHPEIVSNGCNSGKSKSETVFLIRTKKLKQLPLVDFYPVDYGLPHQAFGFSVGPLCLK